MIHWWNEAPTWQRFVIVGSAVALLVLGLQSWVWSPLDHSIAMLTHEIAGLTQKNQASIKSITSLKDVEREVSLLRERVPSKFLQLPVGADPPTVRREIVDIGKRTGVFVRLWKPQQKLVNGEQAEVSLDIIVRVEGSFYGTVQFLDELLQLPWVQTVNPLVLIRKPDISSAFLVMTDFTINGLEFHQFQQTKKLLKT